MTSLLRDIFNHDFLKAGDFHERFFERELGPDDLAKIFATVSESQIETGGKTIQAALRIKGKGGGAPFLILAQMHGNEPAGLAGILLAIALSEAGRLERDVIGAVGNPLAAAQYFKALAEHPESRQESRDCYRCGLSDDGTLLPDMNRIPLDFMERDPATPHIQRARELYALAAEACGILDIHSARGNMVCVTDHRNDADLRNSPIRSVLIGLSDAIAAHASGTAKVATFKAIAGRLPNIESQTGIEAGRHEDADAPGRASAFTLALLHTLGISTVPPEEAKDSGEFIRYDVKPKITYADLAHDRDDLLPEDRVYMAKKCSTLETLPERCGQVIVEKKDGDFAVQTVLQFIVKPEGKLKYAVYQYDEMEAVKKDDTLAVAVPSGAMFKAASDFSGIFFSKSAALYDKDPAVGPWPVPADRLKETKFCFPCAVSKWNPSF